PHVARVGEEAMEDRLAECLAGPDRARRGGQRGHCRQAHQQCRAHSHARTTRYVPPARSATPASLAAVIGWRWTPRMPSWSTTSASVSWPAMVAAVTPPAPSERTVISTVVTYAAPSTPPSR